MSNMEKDIIHTLNYGERVTSSYAEIYFDDCYCDHHKVIQDILQNDAENILDEEEDIHGDDWKSPSDLLIGKVELKPPFTSKITRGKTHEGILAIGDTVLKAERVKFLENLNNVLEENDSAWTYVLEHERKAIWGRVKNIYDDIFLEKSKIMSKEILKFYESTLQDLENFMRSEIQVVLISAHSNIISDFNIKMKSNLEKERQILDNILLQKYESEITKVKEYYRLLLRNEIYRNNKLVNKALYDRNDHLNAFFRQIDAENFTSVMYIMSAERKKCKIKRFILENYQTMEKEEKIKNLKKRQEIIDDFKSREKCISQINHEWEENIKKLNEIQKSPKACSILKNEEEDNIFRFEEIKVTEDIICDKDPFVIVGELSDIPPPVYGSRETLPSDVDLPFVRLQRQFVYAKCHKFEEIKAFFDAQRCKCSDVLSTEQLSEYKTPSVGIVKEKHSGESQQECKSSNESMPIDDFGRLRECPVRRCTKDWTKKMSFPDLNSYLDFTEQNYERVKVIIGEPSKQDITPELVCAKDIAFREIPFAPTKELYHDVGTQYSSQEDLNIPTIECPCIGNVSSSPSKFVRRVKETPTELLNQILTRRRKSLQMLINENPRLLKMFTDECFDFQF